MAKETYDFDFVYTADDGRQILIPNQSVSDEKKRTDCLRLMQKRLPMRPVITHELLR